MKKFMMKYLMVSCKEATFLTSKKEEGKISFMDRVNLSLHTTMCSMCRQFEKQTIKIVQESKFIQSDISLSTASKERIQKNILDHNH